MPTRILQHENNMLIREPCMHGDYSALILTILKLNACNSVTRSETKPCCVSQNLEHLAELL